MPHACSAPKARPDAAIRRGRKSGPPQPTPPGGLAEPDNAEPDNKARPRGCPADPSSAALADAVGGPAACLGEKPGLVLVVRAGASPGARPTPWGWVGLALAARSGRRGRPRQEWVRRRRSTSWWVGLPGGKARPGAVVLAGHGPPRGQPHSGGAGFASATKLWLGAVVRGRTQAWVRRLTSLGGRVCVGGEACPDAGARVRARAPMAGPGLALAAKLGRTLALGCEPERRGRHRWLGRVGFGGEAFAGLVRSSVRVRMLRLAPLGRPGLLWAAKLCLTWLSGSGASSGAAVDAVGRAGLASAAMPRRALVSGAAASFGSLRPVPLGGPGLSRGEAWLGTVVWGGRGSACGVRCSWQAGLALAVKLGRMLVVRGGCEFGRGAEVLGLVGLALAVMPGWMWLSGAGVALRSTSLGSPRSPWR